MGFGFDGQTQQSIEVDGAPWPLLTTADFRAHRRVPEFYEEQAIADSLMRSAMEIQQQLLNFVNGVTAEGREAPLTVATDVGGVPYVDFNDQQLQVYRGAVFARSHADLLGYFSSVDQRDAGNNKADDVPQQNAMLAQSNRAIRLLLKLGRCGVHSL